MEINFATDLMLGSLEFKKFQDAMSTEGYKKVLKTLIRSTGVLMNGVDSSTVSDALKVIEGSPGGKITIKSGAGINSNFDIFEVLSDLVDHYTSPSDSVTRNIKIKRNTSNIEVGTVSISTNGTITGTSTLFEEVLRGLPDFPVKISFPNSVLNTGEYEVSSVASDVSALLNVAGGVMSAESGVEYQIIGTHTPGISVPTGSKKPYVYDSYTITIDTADVVDENEFIIATVHYTGAVLTIIDQRPSATSNGLQEGPSVIYGSATSPALHAVIGREGDIFDFTLNNSSGISYMTERAEGSHVYLHLIGGTSTTLTFTLGVVGGATEDDVIGFAGDLSVNAGITFQEGDIVHCIFKNGLWHVMNRPTRDKGLLTNKKILDIGNWDMDVNPTISVAHLLTQSKIRQVSFYIRDDVNTIHYSSDQPEIWSTVTAANIVCNRLGGGIFDVTGFSTPPSSNRGYIVIEYID